MAGFPPDVAYCLDSAVELGEITPDIHAFLSVFHPDPVGWHDRIGQDGNYFALLRTTSRSALASWRAVAALADRAAITWAGICHLPHFLMDSGRSVLSEAIKVSATDGVIDTSAVSELVRNPDFARLHGKPLVPAFSEIALRAGDDIRIMGIDTFISAREMLPTLHQRERARRNEIVEAAIMSPDARPRPEARRFRKARRKPLRRSAEFLASILGHRRANAFLGGDDIVVEGRDFDFRVRKGVLSSNGHGALNITVTDKHHIELVDLCFYFHDMPAPDQMAALVMHVQAGNERKIIGTGNFIRAHAGAAANVELARIRAERDAEFRAEIAARPGSDDRQNAMEVHLDTTLYGGVRGGSRTYNELHDILVPEAMKTLAADVLVSPAAARLSQACRIIEAEFEAACIAFSRIGTARPQPAEMLLADIDIDQLVECLPTTENEAVWRELVEDYEITAAP